MSVVGLYLLAKCQQCEKKYKIPVKKLQRKRMRFSCSNCSAIVTIHRPDLLDPPSSNSAEKVEATDGIKDKAVGPPLRYPFRMRLKTLMPFFMIYIVVFMVLIYVTDTYVKKQQHRNMRSSADVAEFITKKMVVQFSEVMAKQASRYLLTHPYIPKEDFNTDPYLKKSVLQKIGVTGTTWLYERGTKDNDWKIWVDYDPARVGRSIQQMEKELGKHFSQYWNIITNVPPSEGVIGIYKWPDSKGNLRDKFIAATSVEGTPFVLGASIFMDEITVPFKRIESEEAEAMRQTTLLLISVAGFGLLFLLIVAYIGFRPAEVRD